MILLVLLWRILLLLSTQYDTPDHPFISFHIGKLAFKGIGNCALVGAVASFFVLIIGFALVCHNKDNLFKNQINTITIR